MAVDLMGYRGNGFAAATTEDGALKEAATAGIQGVQELLRLISQSQPRNPEPAVEINTVADVTVNNFKKLISLLDRPRAGHARFRKAPSPPPPRDLSEEKIQEPQPSVQVSVSAKIQNSTMGNKNSTEPQQEQPQPEPPSDFTCEICIEPTLPTTKKFTNNNLCAHPFCTDCITKYARVKIEDDRVAEITCPGLNCDNLIDPISCRTLIPPQLFDKWCDLLCERALLGFDRCYCPNRVCSAAVVNECGGTVRRAKCPNCKRLFCFSCKVAWHAGYRCEESGQLRDRNDVAFGVLAEVNRWMRCPQCSHCVERVRGCSIVKCRCGSSFCYKCGRKVHRHWCGCNKEVYVCRPWVRVVCFIYIILLLLFTFWGDYFH